MADRTASRLQRLLGSLTQKRKSPRPVQWGRHDSSTAQRRGTQPEWEYMTYLVVNGRDAFAESDQHGARSPQTVPLQDVLRRAGADRWELAAIDVGARFTIGSHGHEGSIYIFKRPKQLAFPT